MRRLVLCGPPIAGKTTILHAFAASRGLGVQRFEPNSGSGEVRDRGVSVLDNDRQLELMTVCGAVWNDDTWPVVVAGATALVLVLDLQVARAQTDRAFADAVALMPNAPRLGCIVWTKDDLIADGIEERVPSALLSGTVAESWHSFVARQDRSSTLIEPIEWLIRQIGDPHWR